VAKAKVPKQTGELGELIGKLRKRLDATPETGPDVDVEDNKSEEKKPDNAEQKALLKRIRERFKIMAEADQTNREKALEDLKFVHEPGAQWDQAIKKERGDRPCYEFNKLRITIKRVINHIRANRPAGKVRAVEDGDKDTADIYDGLIKNIWNVSDADTVVDYAAEYVVAAGMGAWRVTTEYSDDTAFEQDIFVRPIKNPLCLYADPGASDPFKRDGDDWALIDRFTKNAFEAKWPNAKRVNFEDTEFDDDEDWENDEFVRVCEYWYKKPYEKTLYLLADGKTVEELPPGAQAVKERQVKCNKIYMVIASGDAILEGPKEWAGSMFPFVMVHGEWRVIDGKVEWHGLTRFSKDAQRAYNSSRTAIAETIALAPQAKWLMTPKQFEGLDKHISEAHSKNFPVMFYNADPAAAPPVRLGGPDVPVALMQEAGMASDDIKSTSGIFDSSLGNQTNETSGRAIRARQEQGEIATYNYPDNISKGVRLTNEIVIDLLPKIYDTARSIRILGSDGAEKYAKINTPTQDPQTGEVTIVNDVTRGKYDVTVTSGPNFSTQRQEAAEVYTALGQSVPQVWGVAGDLLMKSMDLPYAHEIAERMKSLLPPDIQQKLADGKEVPPEVQAVMQQANVAMQVAQQQSQLVQQAAAEVEESRIKSEKAKNEAEKVVAEIKTAEERFQAKVDKELARVAMAEANLVKSEAKLDQRRADLTVQGAQVANESQALEQNRESAGLADEAKVATANIQQLAVGFAQLASDLVQRLENPPKTTKRITAKRGPDGLSALIEDLNEAGEIVSTRNAKVSRNGDELHGQVD
jgi:hypothetical protein